MAKDKIQNRHYMAKFRDRERKAGMVRVEVRIPEARRAELLKLCACWRKHET